MPMFERYSENARRSIFFARYEASSFASPAIETEHLLLGLLRESDVMRSLIPAPAIEQMRASIVEQTGMREPAPLVDLPLSHQLKIALAYAVEEVERLDQEHVKPTHLALGLLREPKGLGGRLLREHGVTLEVLRQKLAKLPEALATGVPEAVRDLQLAFAAQVPRLTPEDEPATEFLIR
jgi:ATP-dependent Clp protease ATP-binding subunit ClpC